MSTAYELRMTVSGYDPNKLDAIHEAADEVWDFEPNDWPDDGKGQEFTVKGTSNIRTAASIDDAVEELTHAIWEANGAFCAVHVESLNLDAVPWFDHDELDFEAYKDWKEEDDAD